MEKIMIQNITTQKQYETLCEYLSELLESVRSLIHALFTDQFGNKTFLVSQPNDGAEYGIHAGEFYPYGLLSNIIDRLKKEGKDLPIFHGDVDSLSYHVGHVCSKDFRFINGIDQLPETDEDRRKELGIEFIPDENSWYCGKLADEIRDATDEIIRQECEESE
jgi:hypothetical protein